MTDKLECPVCGTINPHNYDWNSVCILEDNYFCPHCGYFFNMTYGPVIRYPVSILKRIRLIPIWIRYRKVIKDMRLTLCREDRCLT